MSELISGKKVSVIHVASEIVLVGGLLYYVSSTNRKLQSQILELTKRLEHQEQIIKKHNTLLKRIIAMSHSPIPPPPPSTQEDSKTVRFADKQVFIPEKKINKQDTVFPEEDKEEFVEEYTDDFDEDELSATEDLDKEIHEELSELIGDDVDLE